MPTRVAITIAGAVSLGSYEAGVIYELLEAFRTHNVAADAAGTPDAKIYVDVITGASAGGMTAAMLAQRLMFDGGAMEGEFTNPLYYAWVERIDIRELVKLTAKEMRLKWHSLLSSDLIETIGTEMLVDTMAPGSSQGVPHSVVEFERQTPVPISVGLAITNLNGVDFMLPIAGSDEDGFNYTRSVDQKLFKVAKTGLSEIAVDGKPRAAAWPDFRQAAVASGAFPAAFRTQPISRTFDDYGTRLPKKPLLPDLGTTYVEWTASGAETFTYCDGGVLQNQPLGIAKNFIDDRVRAAKNANDANAHKLADDRLYVFISPNSVKSSANTKLEARNVTISDELAALFHTYIRQASFHDWITAEGMNEKVRTLDVRAKQLAQGLANKVVADSDCLLKTAQELNAWLIKDPRERQQTYDRLERQYADELQLVAQSTVLNDAEKITAKDAFLGGVATLEAAAELGERDKMKIVAVIADGKTELAGSGIAAFAGFFSKTFREHDYWMGRVKSRVYLQRQDVQRILKVTSWPEQSKWGSSLEEVKTRLKNPTNINTLPLSFGKMLWPGLGSLLYMFKIRPAIKRTVGLVLFGVGLAALGLVALLAAAILAFIFCIMHGSGHVILK